MRNELHTSQDFDTIVQRAIDFIQSPNAHAAPGAYVPIPLTEDQLEEVRKHVYASSLEELELDSRQ